MGTPYITLSEVQSMGEIYFQFSENVDGSTFEYGDFTVTVNGTVVPVTHIWNGGGGRVSITTTPPIYRSIWDVDLSYNASSGTVNSIRSDSTSDPVASFTLNNIMNMSFVTPLEVSSITRVDASPTNASSLSYSVVFSERVSTYTVDSSDFQLTTTGSASGYVGTPTTSDSGTTWIVPITGVSGDGTIRLDLKSSGTGITSAMSLTAISGGYTSGQAYSVDHSAPTVTGISSSAVNGTYVVGDVIAITVNFSESVAVTGTPQLALETGTIDRTIDYVSGSGTSSLTFNYNVQPGDTSADLDYISTVALSLNGGSIRDAVGNNATLSLASPGTMGSLGASNALVVDAAPSITSGTYDASTGILTVTGTNMAATGGGYNDIDVSKLTLTGQGGNTYTLTSANVEITSSTSFSVTLNSTDQLNVNGLLNKNGTSSVYGTTYNVAGAAGWNVAASSAADTTGNGVIVTNVTSPAITSATFNAMTGVLTVSGSNLVKQVGATNDITVSTLTIAGEGGSGSAYTLTSADVEIASGSTFSVTLNATDLAYINQILNKNGTSSSGGSTYNLAAVDDWNTVIGNTNISDSTNGITVSNVTVPSITSATYDGNTGVLVVTGTGFTQSSGATNDIVANRFTFTGNAGATRTLTDTANAEITSGTRFTLTLSATDKAAVNLLLNQNGTSSSGATTYNLAAAEDWAAGADAAVVVADLTGNGITVSNAVDSTPPSAPSTPDMSSGSDSGTSSTDNITNVTTPSFSGTTEANATVHLYDTDGTTQLGTTTADGAGNWSITSTTLSEGTHTVTTKATDASNNTSVASSGLSVTIDTTAPSAPSAPDMVAGSDSGVSSSDDITNDTTPTFTGTSEANASVTMYDTDGTTVLGTTTADGSGNWSLTSSTLSTGNHTLTTKASDVAGNVSSASNGLSVSIETTGPTLQSTTPADNATSVAVAANVLMSFAEDVIPVAGKSVNLYKTADNSLVESIAVNDVTKVTVAGGVVTVNPTVTLAEATGYYVRVDNGAFADAAGNDFSGISSTTDFDFTTLTTPPPAAGNQAPTLRLSNPLDNATNVAIDAPIVLTFSELIKAGNGYIFISNVTGTRSSADTRTLAVDDPQVSINGRTLTIDLPSDLLPNSAYHVLIDNGALTDVAGLAYAGINSTTALDFVTASGHSEGPGPTPEPYSRFTDTDHDGFPDALESLNGLTVGIKDNDVTTRDDLFVMQLYRDIFYREADPVGLALWTQALEQNMLSREVMAEAFINSPEFQNIVGSVARLYFGTFDRIPDQAGLSLWISALQSGTPLSDIGKAFVDSEEFLNLYGTLDGPDFIDALYDQILNREADLPGFQHWQNQIAAGVSKGEILTFFTNSPEFTSNSRPEIISTLTSLGLLGALPDQTTLDGLIEDITTGIPLIEIIGTMLSSEQYHDRLI